MLPKILKIKKLIVVFLLFAFLLPISVKTVSAFSSGPNDAYPVNFYNAVFNTDDMNLQSFVYETMRAMIMSVVVLVIGDPSEYEGNESEKNYFD